MRLRYFSFALIVFLVAGLDQLTKYLAVERLTGADPVVIIPDFFNLVLVYNFGAAFGMFNNHSTSWQTWLFILATLLAVVIVLHLLRTLPPGRLYTLALGLILGGALGNLVDRIRSRAVVDFLDFYMGDWHWPAFNVADIAICAGAALAIILLWRTPARCKIQR